MFKIITKLFASDKRFLIGLILMICLSSQGYSQVKDSADGEQVILPYSQEYLDQYNAALDKKAAQFNSTFRSRSKAEAFNNSNKGNLVGACNLITCGSFEKSDVSGGTFRTAIGGVNGQYQADARYTCWNDDGTVDWSEGQYISYSTTNANAVYPGIIEPSTFDGGGFAIFSYQNEAIRQTLTVIPNTVYTVCFEIAVIPRYNTVNGNNNGGEIIEYLPNLQFGVRNGAVQISDPLTYTHANLVQHPTSDFPTRLSFSTSGNGGNQNPGGWTEINPYWENRCITFKAGPNATSVEVFYKTGNPGRSVVLVDGLRLSVEGYANAPTVSPTSKQYCQPTQVALNTFVTSTTPPGAQLKWTTNPDLSVTADHLPNNPTVTTPGVWYAFYFNPVLGCTSPSRQLTLTTTDLDSSFTKQNVTCFGGNNGSINLSVTGGSGSYTYAWTASNGGSGLNPNAQDQSGLTAGTYNVTVNDGNCTTQETIIITQPNQINVDAGNYGPLCDNVSPITLTGTPTNSNGTWSGTGVTDNGNGTATFNPAGLFGNNIVTYNYTNNSGCSNSDTATIVVNKSPTVDAGNYGPLCDNVSPITLTGTPTNSNGTWSGMGVTNNGNGTATFNPAGLSGSITVTYSYTDGNSCSNSDTANIMVNTAPTVDAGNYGPLCDNVNPIILTGTPTNSNGTWSGTGVTNNGNGTATFNPAGLSGSITVTYSYTDGNGCSNSDTANIMVNTSPTVDAGNYGPLCDNVSPITLTGTPANSNGTWSGIGVTNNGNGTATFNPAGLSGSITVTYSYTDGNSCSNSDTANIMVNTAPTVDAGNYGPLCDNVSPITLTGTPTNSNGTWSGTGVTNNGNGTATFNPAGLSGSITVTYSYTDGNSCSNSDTANIMVNTSPTVDAGNYGPLCDNVSPITLTGTPTNSNGTWSGTGVTNNGNGTATFNPAGLSGSIIVTYSYTDGNSCSNSDTANIMVNTSPSAPVSGGNQTECALDPIQTLTATATVPGGQSIVWYDLAVGGSVVTPTWNTIGSKTYYAEAINNATNCKSSTRTPVTLILNNCGIQIEKIASPNNPQGCTPLAPGETISYTFKVSNLGNTPINNVVLNDPLIDPINPIPGPTSGDTTNPGVLDVGEIWVYNATYIVLQQDIINGQVQNTATVNGLVQTSGNPYPVTNSDTVTVNLCQNAEMSIVKSSTSATGDCIAFEVDDTIDYKFVVTNEGDVDITNVVVNDAKLGGVIAGPAMGDVNNDNILNVGEVWTYNATYMVTQDDIDFGSVVNTASVNGNTALGQIDDTSNTVTVFICQNADIAIVKESDQIPGHNGCVELAEGDTITYTFRVTNEGNVSIDNVAVTDPLVGLSAITGPTGDTGSDGILGLNEIWEYTATYTVTQDDVDDGEVTNQAAVNGLAMNPSNTPVSDDSHPTSTTADGDTVVVICQNADIAIVKESDQIPGHNGCVELAEGDTITYTFRVTNEGNVSIDNVAVTDPLVGLSAITGPTGDTGSDGILGLNEIWEYTATYTVTQDDVDDGEVTNQAAVNGLAMNPSNTPVSDDSHPTSTTADGDTVVVICQNADIAIVKESDQIPGHNGCVELAEGDTITYTFRVTNEGNVSIDNVTVTDPLVGLSAITGPTGDTGSDGILGLNEVWEYTATYTITQDDVDDGEVTNQAAVNGLAMNPSNTPVSDDSHPTSTTADGETVVVICQNADIAIVKESDQIPGNNGCVELAEGDIITYTFRVTNEGNVSIDNVAVTDPLVGLSAITGPTGDTGSDGILGLNEIWEYTATYTVTQGDVDDGEVTNQAAVNGLAMNPSNTPVSDDSHPTSTTADGETVVVICQNADIAIVKESDQIPGHNGCVELAEGDIITYTFRVTNEGNVSIDNVAVTDPLVGLSAITGPTGDTGSDGILGLNEIWEYTATYTVTQDDVDDGEVTNQAAVNGLAMNPSNTPVSDDSHPTSTTADGETFVVICQNADIAIVKTGIFNDVDGNQCADAGIDTITYTFTVTNEGNVSLSGITVTDPLLQAPNPIVDIVFQGGDTDGDNELDVTETWTYTATSYTITQDDIDMGEVVNQATATGTAPDQSTVSDLSGTEITNDDETVIELCQNPDIAIVKTGIFNDVDGNQCADAGIDTITYTFTVTNEGNVSLSGITVTDPLLQAPNPIVDIVFQGGDTDGDNELDVTETWTYTATSYTITQDDIDMGEVVNQATATGTAPDQSTVSDLSGTEITNDDETVIELCQNPDIAIVKTGIFNDVDGNQCADAGIDTITYTFTVTNEGNVSLSGITVTDPLLQAPNPIVDIVFQGGDTDGDNELDVTETWTYTATSYTITQDDIDAGEVVNQATAMGTAPDQSTVSDLSGTEISNDDETVIELCQNPDIAIVKTGIFNDVDGNQCADAGIDTITYTFTVTNEGNVSLSGITVTDPLLQAPNPIVDIVFQGGDTDGDNELDVTETWTYTATSYTITQDDIDAGEVVNQATATGTAPDQSTVSDLSGTDVANDDETVVELCQDPAIAIVKTGIFNDENQNDCADVDETISFTFTVTNEGNVSLSNIVVDDPLLGGPIAGPDSGDTDGDGELDVTETWIYSGTYTITQDDIDAGEVINQATATGTAPDQSTVSDLSGSTTTTDDATVIELCQNPAIAVVKTGIFNDENQNDCADVDETISYTFTVTNEGNVSLSNVTVTDPLIATITGPTGDTDGDGELDVTETWVFTGNYTITQTDIDLGLVKNQATAEGTAPDATVVSDLSDESSVLENDPTIIELCQDPAIAIVKTGIFNDENQNDCADVDETISYTFTVTNEGNVSLSSVEVTDPLLGGPIAGPDSGDTDGDGELDVTETWIYTGNYSITQDDIDAGEVVNQATAKANDPKGNAVSDLSDESSVLENDPTIIELCQDPVIAIVKTGIFNDENQNDCADVDETISYTFTVTNEGNVSLSNVTVTDPMIATITGPTGDTDGDEELDVTETWIYTGTYAITQVDIDAGEVVNQATAEGTAPDATVVTDLSDESSVLEDDPTIIDLCQNPVIALVKTGVVNDTNGNGCADVGETIDYSFSVFNLGNVTLSNINVTDPLVSVVGGPITLAPGATDATSFTATYTITQADIDAGFVENQATATGTDPSGNTVSDLSDDNSEVENDPTITELCQNPAIALIKVGLPNDENGDGCADLGETILYTFSVKNTGNVALTNVIVTDPLVTVVGSAIDLLAGEEDTTTFTAVYTITQSDVDTGLVENQATAEGIAPNGDVVSDLSDNNSYTENDPTIVDVCNTIPPNPSISLEKTGVFNDEDDNGSADIGETISYTFTVTNTGDVTLYNIVITDPLPGIEIFGGPIAELEPGEVDSTTFTATYTINDEDIGNGEVVNQATVTGEDGEGTIVEDESDDPTDLTNTDNNGDGEPDDPTVVILPVVLPATFEIYNGVTPNGDNMNDFFWIKGIHNYPNNNVKIFNRWGILVYETDGYGQGEKDDINTFNGTSEGRVTVQEDKNLPTGTYFYILTFQGENPGKESYTGYLYINR